MTSERITTVVLTSALLCFYFAVLPACSSQPTQTENTSPNRETPAINAVQVHDTPSGVNVTYSVNRDAVGKPVLIETISTRGPYNFEHRTIQDTEGIVTIANDSLSCAPYVATVVVRPVIAHEELRYEVRKNSSVTAGNTTVRFAGFSNETGVLAIDGDLITVPVNRTKQFDDFAVALTRDGKNSSKGVLELYTSRETDSSGKIQASTAFTPC